MIEDLAARVLAAIEEAEQIARASGGGDRLLPRGVSWRREPMTIAAYHPGWSHRVVGGYDSAVVDEAHETVARHIAHNDPATVLRRCAADRKLVEYVRGWQHDYNDDDAWFSCAQAVLPEQWRSSDPEDARPGSGCSNEDRAGGPCDCATGAHLQRVLTALAAGYGVVVAAANPDAS